MDNVFVLMNAKMSSLIYNYFKTLKQAFFLNKDEAQCDMIKYTYCAIEVYLAIFRGISTCNYPCFIIIKLPYEEDCCVFRVAFSNIHEHLFPTYFPIQLSANGTEIQTDFQSPISFSPLCVMESPRLCTKFCDNCITIMLLICFDYKDLAVSLFCFTKRRTCLPLSILHAWQ